MGRSHPAWDAWIEIELIKYQVENCLGRIPHGMRGLKSYWLGKYVAWVLSHPAWDTWIEIFFRQSLILLCYSRIPHGMRGLKFLDFLLELSHCRVASRMGCVDWNFHCVDCFKRIVLSHPAWDAWIEIRNHTTISLEDLSRIPLTNGRICSLFFAKFYLYFLTESWALIIYVKKYKNGKN